MQQYTFAFDRPDNDLIEQKIERNGGTISFANKLYYIYGIAQPCNDSLLALQRIFAQSLDKSISKNNCISYAKINRKSANSNMLFIC